MAGFSRRQIEERVDVIREHHDGEDFAAAVERFSNELDEGELAELREILLERMREHARRNPAFDDRLAQGGFFKRTYRRLDRKLHD
ncbi:MAG: hypothetical protein ABI649_07230 [Gaiellaceae bacterium]